MQPCRTPGCHANTACSFSWPVDLLLAVLMLPLMLIVLPTFLYEAWRDTRQ